MTQASVGFQCPECVKEGQRAVRRGRTVMGGVGGTEGIVTKILVGVNVGVFLIGLILSLSNIGNVLIGGAPTPLHSFGALIPLAAHQDQTLYGVATGEYYRLFTSMFLHYGILHIGFNMYILWVLGRYLERDLGPIRYLALYLVSGLGGSVLTYMLALDPASVQTASAGASGCIFGLFGGAVLINRKLGRDNSGIYVLVVLNLVLTFTVSGISWTAHVGGLVSGALLGALLAHAPRNHRTLIQTAGFAVLLVIFAVLVLWHTGVIDDTYQMPI
ncbi:MAG TPA: rhomboid family intramembrane serine protease [Stackebrandtia sp.]|nr:rhomboid family intramembrane serine protease [Stackebrandtia sp.]HZE37864.1 rhomboid family intramembrane serine protease [Stackebrandtia sp.]